MPLMHRVGQTQTRSGRLWGPLLVAPLLLMGAGFAPPLPTLVPADQTAYDQEITPRFGKYCLSCHGPDKPSGGVNLAAFKTVLSIQKDPATWRRIMIQIRDRQMPPPGVPQPSTGERDLLTRWVHDTLAKTDDNLVPKNPGRVLIHRLSRTEYNNTVRDLFGVESRPADKFPADGSGGGGFDNNADTLFLPPLLMERYIEAAGAVLDEAKPERLFIVRPSKAIPARTAAKQVLAYQATRAYRRPAEAGEVERLLALYDQTLKGSATWENAVRYALKAVLVSPNFLFRAEGEVPGAEDKALPVSDYALASRLSYFLWSSTPDDELSRLAAQNKLHDPQILEIQVRRMLASPKSRAFADGFAGQWLRARELYSTAKPDPKRYPEFTPALRDAMYDETISFFDGLVRDNDSLLNLVDADYTYLNDELAHHYGLPAVGGPKLRRAKLPDGRRGGVLTQASVLTLTSYPFRTSPVLRGKWVMEEILGTPPPPPPPSVATLSQDDKPNKEGLTFRQRLEKHREKPECAGCHSKMDPLGFGLENYDAIGRWRDAISDAPVDASGVLSTGEKFTGPAELKKHLLARKDDFLQNVTEKMLSYALGRGLESYDMPAVRKILSTVQKDNCRTDTLILEIVKSYPFQYRKNS